MPPHCTTSYRRHNPLRLAQGARVAAAVRADEDGRWGGQCRDADGGCHHFHRIAQAQQHGGAARTMHRAAATVDFQSQQIDRSATQVQL